MDPISKEDLKRLMEEMETPCVSIYMPTYRTPPETKQNPLRLKNLIREAEERLISSGLRAPEAKKLLKPVKTLLRDSPFWQHQSEGFATFLSPHSFRTFRLPLTFQELLVVTDRFHIKPLLHFLSHDGTFYILALSQNDVRLCQCTRHSCKDVELVGVPRNMAEALNYDVPEKQLQFHTRAPGMSGVRAAIFHGQGGGIDDSEDNLLRYFQQINHGLREVLPKEKAPVVLAGVEYLLPIYREANTFLHLMEEEITGNPDKLRAEELHQQAWAIVEPYFLKAQQEAVDRYRQWAGSERASTDIKEIIPAAHDGRVELMVVAVGIQQWGSFDPDTLTVHLHQEAEAGDEDLLDLAAIHTFLKGGTVYTVEPDGLPEEAPLAALFRY